MIIPRDRHEVVDTFEVDGQTFHIIAHQFVQGNFATLLTYSVRFTRDGNDMIFNLYVGRDGALNEAFNEADMIDRVKREFPSHLRGTASR